MRRLVVPSGDDAPALRARGVQRRRNVAGDHAQLRVHAVVRRVVGLHRQERARADMKRDAHDWTPRASRAATSSGV